MNKIKLYYLKPPFT